MAVIDRGEGRGPVHPVVRDRRAGSRGSLNPAIPVTCHLSPVTWRRGQSALEYAALAAIVAAALVGMSVYTKRALMGKWRTVGDAFGSGRQFEPARTVVSRQ